MKFVGTGNVATIFYRYCCCKDLVPLSMLYSHFWGKYVSVCLSGDRETGPICWLKAKTNCSEVPTTVFIEYTQVKSRN